MQLLRKSIFILLLSIISIHGYAADVNLHLCGSESENPLIEQWGYNLGFAVKRINNSGYNDLNKEFNISFDNTTSCNEKAKKSCTSIAGDIYCDKKQLTRLVLGIAIMALSIETNKEQTTINIGATYALILADAILENDQLKLNSAIKTVFEHNNVQFEALTKTFLFLEDLQKYDLHGNKSLIDERAALSIEHPIMEASLNYALAYIVGHELAHAYSDCPFTEKSKVEESGLFTKLMENQSAGKLLCPNALLVDEILADRCAIRGVAKMNSSMMEVKKQQSQNLYGTYPSQIQFLHSLSRKIALDMFSVMLTTGLGSKTTESVEIQPPGEDGLTTIRYTLNSSAGYIYGANRILLFSEELRQSDIFYKDFVGLCDDTARIFVLSTNFEVSSCKASLLLKSDRIDLALFYGKYVPRGVVQGWMSGVWNDSAVGTYSCSP